MQETKVLLHLNGDQSDNSPDNLMYITRGELVRLNRQNAINTDPNITLLNLDIVRLSMARAKAVKGSSIERDDKREAERRYQKTEKGRQKACESTKRYWQKHSLDPEWRKQYNEKQRERRLRNKGVLL